MIGLAVVVLPPVLVAVVNALASLVWAVVVMVAGVVGVVTAGAIAVKVGGVLIDDWSLRRHNARMAQLHPHLRNQLPAATQRPAIAPARPAVTPVRIYPTPRKELTGGRGGRAV